jgi:hypothetical protein
MRLCTIICESMTMDDLDGQVVPGHVLVPFDPHPATFSAQSLWLLQSSQPLPPPKGNPHEGTSWFEGVECLSNRVKTRLVSNFWPKAYDPTCLDPECADKEGKKVGMEPDNHQWNTLMAYMDGPRPHDWLIFWPTMGHAGYRVPEENKGVPWHVKATTRAWLDLVAKSLLPRLDCPVILFSDHGSARAGRTRDEQFRNGFAFVPADDRVPCRSPLDWAGMRALQEHFLCP